MPRINGLCRLAAVLLIALCGTVARGDQRAVLLDGRIVNGRISGATAATLAFVAAEARSPIPLRSISRIVVNEPMQIAHSERPGRRIVLQGDESLSGDVGTPEGDDVELRFRTGATLRVPSATIAGVHQPAGELNFVYDDFESRPGIFTGDGADLSAQRHRSGSHSLRIGPSVEGCRFDVPQPIAAGRVDLAFFDTAIVHPGRRCELEFVFETADGPAAVTVELGWSERTWGLAADERLKLETDRLPRERGWHDLTMMFDGDRILVVVDQLVLSRGPAVGGTLRSILVRSRSMGPTDGKVESRRKRGDDTSNSPEMWFDDFKVTRHTDVWQPPVVAPPSDRVWLASGDELFGTIASFDQRTVAVTGAFGARRLRWGDVRGVEFVGRRPPPAAPVSGFVATIDLAPRLGARAHDPERLVAAIESADDDGLDVHHPYLGKLRLPYRDIRQIVPIFHGTMLMIDPVRHHLGDEIRDDFRMQVPEATRLERRFMLEAVPAGRAFLSVVAADLEPAGPQAPRDGKFRDELAAGHLRTTVYVNGKPVDDLNRYANLRGIPENPVRIRIPLPDTALKAGENTVRLEQRPSQADKQQFDDFEFSRLAVEIEE